VKVTVRKDWTSGGGGGPYTRTRKISFKREVYHKSTKKKQAVGNKKGERRKKPQAGNKGSSMRYWEVRRQGGFERNNNEREGAKNQQPSIKNPNVSKKNELTEKGCIGSFL